jgi:MYXO-CTERM domain-containing protein
MLKAMYRVLRSFGLVGSLVLSQAGVAFADADEGSGCACKVGAQRGSWASSFALAVAALGLLRARRRRAG